MSENGEAQNETPSESEKMDISEMSDVFSPVSDQSPLDIVDNARQTSRSTVTYMTCQSHPLDNATPSNSTPTTTSGVTTRERLDSTLSLEAFDLELPTLDKYQEEYVDFPSSPKQLKETQGHSMPLEAGSESAAGGASDEEDDTSIYQAVLSPDCRDVRLKKEELEDTSKQKLRRILTPNPEDLILPHSDHSEEKIIYESNEPLERLGYKKLDVIENKNNLKKEDSGFVFERRNSKRLAKKDVTLNGRIMEGLFVESRNKHENFSSSSPLRRITVPESLQNFESPTKEDASNDLSSENILNNSDNLNNSENLYNSRELSDDGDNDETGNKSEEFVEPEHFNVNVEIFDSITLSRNDSPEPHHPETEEAALDRPGSLVANQRGGRRKIKLSAALLAADDGDVSSDESRVSGASPVDDLDMDELLGVELDSPDEVEDSILERLGEPTAVEPIPEMTAAEERAEARSWRSCNVAGSEKRIDMKVIEPYKRVLSHGGYMSAGSHNAIIVFSACFLPDRSRLDYTYVMDNLFFYVLVTLEQLVTEDYVLVYLHGASQRTRMPTFSWLKRCYQMIDRRLRKNLKGLYLVHPTFWLKTIVLMTKPFVSTKFSRKLSFVETLSELGSILPLEQASIPDRVKQLDAELTGL